MRVLIAAGIYPPDVGGPAIHAKAQLEGFPKYGCETGLVALAHFKEWPRGIRHLLYFLKLLSSAREYNAIYAHDALGAGIPAYIVAKLFNKIFLVRVGGDITWEYRVEDKPLSMREWYEQGYHLGDRTFNLSRWVLRRADAVIAPSRLLATLYANFYGVESSKIRVVWNPLPKVSVPASTPEKTIIFASRLVAYKNVELVLRALSQIFPTYPDLKFVIIGNGPDKHRLENIAHKLGITSNVIFAGSMSNEEVMKHTASSLFTIAPALTEFNPNYVLQGIALGKPFLISREHGLPFNVPETFMFDPRSEDELSIKITSLLDEKGYGEAVDYVKSIDLKMSWDDNLGENVGIISALLKEHKK